MSQKKHPPPDDPARKIAEEAKRRDKYGRGWDLALKGFDAELKSSPWFRAAFTPDWYRAAANADAIDQMDAEGIEIN